MATNLATQNPNATVETYLSNSTFNSTTGELNIILARSTVALIPTGAGYAVGCLLQASDTGNNYVNTGTTTAASFTLLDAGTAFSLPTSATDSTTTTGTSLGLTTSAVTTGKSVAVIANALTTGSAFSASSSSTSGSSRSLFTATNTGAGSTGLSLFGGTQVVQSTHFYKILNESASGVTLWFSDGTTASSNLSGTAGDICFNGGSHKPEYCVTATTWVALV